VHGVGRIKRSRFNEEQIIGILKEQKSGMPTVEDENAKLKKLLAEAMLDIAVLKDIAGKKW
jgi:putative transposase